MTTLKPLTRRQQDVLRALIELWQRHGQAPTLGEIGDSLGITQNSVIPHIRALRAAGYITHQPRRPHSARPLFDEQGLALAQPTLDRSPEPDSGDMVCVRILGRIAAGAPLEAREHIQGTLMLDRSMLPGVSANDRVFALRVQGDSMIGDNIFEGDILIVRHQKTARSGQIVVALIDDEATVKRFHQSEGVVGGGA